MATKTITVQGMTCGHCAASVTEELQAIAGVTSVAVDLHPGEPSPVTIESAGELDDAAVAAAVAEAGYTLS